jgi:phage-related minor tail protein
MTSLYDAITSAVTKYIAELIYSEVIMVGIKMLMMAAADGVAFGGPGQVQAFAGGGAFTNKVVGGPTLFNVGMMGEAGPEAIMPLARVGGKLGVHTTGGGGDNYNISISAVDAASVSRLFYANGDALVHTLRQRQLLNKGTR